MVSVCCLGGGNFLGSGERTDRGWLFEGAFK